MSKGKSVTVRGQRGQQEKKTGQQPCNKWERKKNGKWKEDFSGKNGGCDLIAFERARAARNSTNRLFFKKPQKRGAQETRKGLDGLVVAGGETP